MPMTVFKRVSGHICIDSLSAFAYGWASSAGAYDEGFIYGQGLEGIP